MFIRVFRRERFLLHVVLYLTATVGKYFTETSAAGSQLKTVYVPHLKPKFEINLNLFAFLVLRIPIASHQWSLCSPLAQIQWLLFSSLPMK